MKLRYIPILMTVMLLVAWTSPTLCAAKSYPSLNRGVRPMGMGGAFTAVADDANALFYNPAGLSSIKHLKLGIVNPMIGLSKNSWNLLKDAKDTDFNQTGQVADLMRKYVGEHQHAQASFYPHVGLRLANVGVMIGGLASVQVDADIRNPAWPEAHLDLVQDYGLIAGAGLEVPITGLRLGLSGKYINRRSLEQIYTASDIADERFEDRLKDDLKSGQGVSLDAGVIYTLPFIPFIKTDIGLVVQNIPQMDMGEAKDIRGQANVGLALEKKLALFKLTGALDYMDLTNNLEEDKDIAKRIHMGLELETPWFVSVRAGLNQGYPTCGATVDFRFVRLDLAYYTEEVGAYAGQRADHRYIGQLTFGW